MVTLAPATHYTKTFFVFNQILVLNALGLNFRKSFVYDKL